MPQGGVGPQPLWPWPPAPSSASASPLCGLQPASFCGCSPTGTISSLVTPPRRCAAPRTTEIEQPQWRQTLRRPQRHWLPPPLRHPGQQHRCRRAAQASGRPVLRPPGPRRAKARQWSAVGSSASALMTVAVAVLAPVALSQPQLHTASTAWTSLANARPTVGGSLLNSRATVLLALEGIDCRAW